METNKVIRSETRRILRRLKVVAATVLVIGALLALVVCAVVRSEGRKAQGAIKSVQEDVIADCTFDTSELTHKYSNGAGTIRMVEAKYYEDNVVEDDCGQLWKVHTSIKDTGKYLLWIADRHTPEDLADDAVIHAWAEDF